MFLPDARFEHGPGLATKIETLGKSPGPPWGNAYEDAALVAMVALQGPAK
jgi:hypothetical protein